MNKKNILITGASAGIGSALALRFANTNTATRLFLLARNEKKLKTVADSCLEAKANNDKLEVIIHPSDVSKTDEIQALIEKIDEEYPIDLIICNAGVTNSVGRKGQAETWDEITQVIDINVYGVLACLNPLISRMQQRKQGQIAIVSSLAAFYGMPVTPIYCASKAAVKCYGESLRGWLKHDNIKVNMIYPGFVKTDLSDQLKVDKHFMITTEKAADIIATGIEKNKASISFPWILTIGIRSLNILPSRLADFFMGVLFGAKRR